MPVTRSCQVANLRLGGILSGRERKAEADGGYISAEINAMERTNVET